MLDRERLLAASLGSLLKNTEPRNTAWFAKFHELLEPSVDERQTLQASYLHLLSHPVPAVVGMALDALTVLEKAQKLEAAGFIASVPAVFHTRTRAQPLSAIKLLGRTAARETGLAPEIASSLLSGLAHPEAQVQQAAINHLGKLKENAAATIAAQLPGLIDALAPSVQEDARKLLGAPAHQAQVAESALELADLLAEARQVSSPWRELAGIDQIVQAIDNSGELTAVPFDPMAVPRLDPSQRIDPIQTLDELIERLTVAVETLEDGVEFELLMDGMSRLCDQRPADFDARAAPLLHRTGKVVPRGAVVGLPFLGLRAPVIKLVRRWCDRDVTDSHEERDSILGFLDVRVRILSMRLRKKESAPLLACPTHRSGWIDARVMLERLAWFEQNQVEPSQYEFIQAILRLAPDHRAETLSAAQTLNGKVASAFRYVLGGPLPDELPPSFLVAAGRARAPLAALGAAETSEALTGPDAAQPARYSWDEHLLTAETPTACPSCGQKLRTPEARQCFKCGADWHQVERVEPTHWFPRGALVRLAVEPTVPPLERIRDQPTVLLHTWLIPFESGFPGSGGNGVLKWVRTVWPSNLDPFFVIGIRLRTVDFMSASVYRLRAPFLEALLDPDVPFTDVAQLLIALALSQAEPEVTGLAVDALIEVIRDGRCVGPELGDVVGRLLLGDQVKLNRLAKHLEIIARVSAVHTHVCAQVAQVACSKITEIPNDMHYLLGPLLEWLTSLNQSVRPELRPILEQTTRGKAAGLARRMLALQETSGVGVRVFREALQGRLERVRRWESSCHNQNKWSEAKGTSKRNDPP
jgi:hypothetical protein